MKFRMTNGEFRMNGQFLVASKLVPPLLRERFHGPEYANRAPEPTPSPSQEGSSARWLVPLLGGVRGRWAGGRFMGRAGVRAEQIIAQPGGLFA